MRSMKLLWPPDVKNWLIGKVHDAGKDWRWEENADDRGWDDWRTSLMRWTWVWVCSRSWWWTGKPGVLQSMGSQRVRHSWAMNWTEQEEERSLSWQGLSQWKTMNSVLQPSHFPFPTIKVFSFPCRAGTCIWFSIFANPKLQLSTDPKYSHLF